MGSWRAARVDQAFKLPPGRALQRLRNICSGYIWTDQVSRCIGRLRDMCRGIPCMIPHLVVPRPLIIFYSYETHESRLTLRPDGVWVVQSLTGRTLHQVGPKVSERWTVAICTCTHCWIIILLDRCSEKDQLLIRECRVRARKHRILELFFTQNKQ